MRTIDVRHFCQIRFQWESHSKREEPPVFGKRSFIEETNTTSYDNPNEKEKEMKTRIIAVLVFVAACALMVQASETVKKVENFTLEDFNGIKHSLKDYASSKAIVLMFIATQCPVSNAYNERMELLCKEYASKGVAFLGINSNKQETVEEIKEHAKEHGFSFPILKDRNNVIADKVAASVTPEIFVLNKKLEVLYHGRIDDSRRASDVKSQDLRAALDALLAGKPVAVTQTKAFGCSIKRIN